MTRRTRRVHSGFALALATLALSACDIGGKESRQLGYRGTAMALTVDKSELNKKFAAVHIPTPLPPSPPASPGPLPWKNVQVLTDVSVAELNRTMIAMTNWVAGANNCAYCHNLRDLAADTLENGTQIYTKIVARRMLQMTRHINGQYQPHVANTGVTCYTCHKGKPLPEGLWFYGKQTDHLRHYLDRDGARVVSQTVGPSNANRSSVKQTEWTYALMLSQSKALGVGCTYCHNSRQFSSWQQAPPQRVTAYHGILMLRDLNSNYLSPLQSVYPASRLGKMGDAPKAQCITCHGGVYKPLYAAQMAKDYPALWGRSEWNGAAFPALDLTPPAATPPATTAPAAPAQTSAVDVQGKTQRTPASP